MLGQTAKMTVMGKISNINGMSIHTFALPTPALVSEGVFGKLRDLLRQQLLERI